jgi:hypothetical protein
MASALLESLSGLTDRHVSALLGVSRAFFPPEQRAAIVARQKAVPSLSLPSPGKTDARKTRKLPAVPVTPARRAQKPVFNEHAQRPAILSAGSVPLTQLPSGALSRANVPLYDTDNGAAVIQPSPLLPSQANAVDRTLAKRIYEAIKSDNMRDLERVAAKCKFSEHQFWSSLPGLHSCWTGTTPLHVAAMSGSHGVLRYLLQDNHLPVNTVADFGDTPLHVACWRGDETAVRILLESGADLEARNEKRGEQRPLHIAALKVSAVAL